MEDDMQTINLDQSKDRTSAMREVMVREMNNSDNAHLRVWKGRL